MKKKKKEKSFPGDRSQCLSQGWRISVPEQLVMMVTMLQWWQQKHTALFYVPEPISAWHVLAHLILSTTLGDGTVVLLYPFTPVETGTERLPSLPETTQLIGGGTGM